ncbi:hypothetical protein BHU72_07830 [Desulfuribacillus stibiiarsenatis]|uniref:Dihydroorotate dehydrogenase B (NAD(+)), electron transfer subunit n=1 Tax=Desulfuribacillus stibiiarsenatis TaxID=1390249 RepID=A0A1E5L3R1_9FIRM|nr:dihydroorotate dehydrogenase electron transfer subunit [Desulfuribacillus stibiiarsenatis]OEH84734.1 hypothetical protein BHU72_07830 [Desulfuribacillus stibiiarsenatis]
MKHSVEVKSHKTIGQDLYEMIVIAPKLAQTAHPGQFVHIRVIDSLDPLLRRPISICDVDKKRGSVRFIYRAGGKGTKILSKSKEMTKIDLLGPLGRGTFPTENQAKRNMLLIGGGIGVPPLLYAAKELAKQGASITAILGFANHQVVILEDEFRELGDVIVTTVDGSYGKQGFVTEYITKEPDLYLACGPKPMLQAIKNHELLQTANGYLSLEEHMACGIGACMGCVTKISISDENSEWKYRKVCDCGPVFPAERVVF